MANGRVAESFSEWANSMHPIPVPETDEEASRRFSKGGILEKLLPFLRKENRLPYKCATTLSKAVEFYKKKGMAERIGLATYIISAYVMKHGRNGEGGIVEDVVKWVEEGGMEGINIIMEKYGLAGDDVGRFGYCKGTFATSNNSLENYIQNFERLGVLEWVGGNAINGNSVNDKGRINVVAVGISSVPHAIITYLYLKHIGYRPCIAVIPVSKSMPSSARPWSNSLYHLGEIREGIPSLVIEDASNLTFESDIFASIGYVSRFSERISAAIGMTESMDSAFMDVDKNKYITSLQPINYSFSSLSSDNG